MSLTLPTPSPTTATPPSDSRAPDAGSGFELILARSQMRLAVQPGETMADVLMLAGIAIDTVCEQGVCGTCVTRWIEGTPEHCDTCLTPEEQATHVAVCCARSQSPTLTLDL